MGDLRNKLAKQARTEATLRMQERLRPKTPTEPPLRCQGCGRPSYEVQALYALPCERWQVQRYGCTDCLPTMGFSPPLR